MNIPTNVFQIKNLADLRVFLLYVGVPVFVALVVGKGWLEEGFAQQIGLAVIAAVPSAVAVFTSTDKLRSWLYGLLGAIAPIMIALGWIDNSDWQLWLPVITLFLSNGVPAQNAPTTVPFGNAKAA